MTVYYTAYFEDVNNNLQKSIKDYTIYEIRKEVVKNLDACSWTDKEDVDLRSPISMFKYLATKGIKEVHVALVTADSTRPNSKEKVIYKSNL